MAEAPASRLSDSVVFVVLAGDLSALFLPGTGGLQHTKPSSHSPWEDTELAGFNLLPAHKIMLGFPTL